MGKFDGMDPKLVRELLAETKRAAVELRETEARVSRILSRAGVSVQTTHRPSQLADEAAKMVKDVTARLELLEKRAAGENRSGDTRTDPPARDPKPEGEKNGSKPETEDKSKDGRGEKPDADRRPEDKPGEKDDKPDVDRRPDKDDARGEKPDADRRPEDDGTCQDRDKGSTDDKRKDTPTGRDPDQDKPDVGTGEQKPDAENRPERDGPCETPREGDRGIRFPETGSPDARGDAPTGRDPYGDAGRPEQDGRQDAPTGRDPYGEKPEGDGRRQDVPVGRDPEGDTGRQVPDERGGACDAQPGTVEPEGERRGGSPPSVIDTSGVDHPDDIPTGKAQIVEIDGVKVLQVPIDPPTAEELQNLLDNLDQVRPADMPTLDATGRHGTPGSAVQDAGASGQDGSMHGQDGRGHGQDNAGAGQGNAGTGQDARMPGQDSPGEDGAGYGRDGDGSAGRTPDQGQDGRAPGQDGSANGQDTCGPGQSSPGTGQESRTPGQEDRTPGQDGRDAGRDVRVPGQDGSATGQDGSSRDTGTGLVVPPTPGPDNGATVSVSLGAPTDREATPDELRRLIEEAAERAASGRDDDGRSA
jgi:hypothetical protein